MTFIPEDGFHNSALFAGRWVHLRRQARKDNQAHKKEPGNGRVHFRNAYFRTGDGRNAREFGKTHVRSLFFCSEFLSGKVPVSITAAAKGGADGCLLSEKVDSIHLRCSSTFECARFQKPGPAFSEGKM